MPLTSPADVSGLSRGQLCSRTSWESLVTVNGELQHRWACVRPEEWIADSWTSACVVPLVHAELELRTPPSPPRGRCPSGSTPLICAVAASQRCTRIPRS
jgi:hypothetical protein